MAIIDREALQLMKEVREHYPITFEWAQSKAKWEAIPLGAVFMEYPDHVKEMMRGEKESALY